MNRQVTWSIHVAALIILFVTILSISLFEDDLNDAPVLSPLLPPFISVYPVPLSSSINVIFLLSVKENSFPSGDVLDDSMLVRSM